MINKYDLYDISFALVTIRNDIREKSNTEILTQIIDVLQENNCYEDNQIRRAISTISTLDREKWFFVYHNNLYVNHLLLKNDSIYELLIASFQHLANMLTHNQFEQAYDLIDCIHCLPEIIADNHFTIPRAFWKHYVTHYRKKWDKSFLKKYQKRR